MTYEVLDSCMLVPGLSQSACAAWVQAWGSIGAILAAIWVGSRQAASARKLQQEIAAGESRRQLAQAAAILRSSRNAAERAFTKLEIALSGVVYSFNQAKIQEVHDVLSQALALPMPIVAVEAFADARMAVAELAELLSAVDGRGIAANAGVEETIGRIRAVLQRAIDQVEAAQDSG